MCGKSIVEHPNDGIPQKSILNIYGEGKKARACIVFVDANTNKVRSFIYSRDVEGMKARHFRQ